MLLACKNDLSNLSKSDQLYWFPLHSHSFASRCRILSANLRPELQEFWDSEKIYERLQAVLEQFMVVLELTLCYSDAQ